MAYLVAFPAAAKAPAQEVGLGFSQTFLEVPFVESPLRPKLALGGPIDEKVRCSCVEYAKLRTGRINEVWGYPNKMTAYDTLPYPGGILITNEGEYGHVAYIERVGDSRVFVSEANWKPCEITKRWVSFDDPIIRGVQ